PPAAPSCSARMANPALVPVVLIRREGGRGYDLLIQPALEDYPLSDEQAAAAYMNKVIEKEIMRAPEQYMWLHRRPSVMPPSATDPNASSANSAICGQLMSL
ncbi:hypothetical protein ISX56_33745, partial [Serratia ureilytica]|nr:hypothetical protein [Serratia ureilytica]